MFQKYYICRVYKLTRKVILTCAVLEDAVGSQHYETSWCEQKTTLSLLLHRAF
jgi:hypothetical protein